MIIEMKYKCGCVMTRERESEPFVEKNTCVEHYAQRTHAGRSNHAGAQLSSGVAHICAACDIEFDTAAESAAHVCSERTSRALTKADIAMQAAAELASEGRPPFMMDTVPPPPIHTLCEPNGMLAKKQAPNDIQPHVFQEGKDGYCTVCNTLEKYIPGRHIPTRKMFVPMQLDEMPGKPHVMREIEIPDEESTQCVKSQAPGYNTFEVSKPSFYASEGGQHCAEGRDHPGRWFVCHVGLDDNICEVFEWNGRSAEKNANDIARALNNQLTRDFESKGGPKSGTVVESKNEYANKDEYASKRDAAMVQLTTETHPIYQSAVAWRDAEWRVALQRAIKECDARWGTRLEGSVEVGSAGPSVIALTALMLAAWQAGRDDCIKRLTEKMVEITRVK